MQHAAFPIRLNPDHWIDAIFSARAARTGGIVRRAVPWVHREIGRDRFVEEVRRRGFHLVRCGSQYVVICSKDGLKIIC
ncbi:N-(5'-phosphoribosyl)anthranilate isomerase [Tropicimonas sp. IMCC34011]|uniref:N-(5'-phosphoribosyl)anthranilate isomerase n=1 Tax=Tropicimonas sp. IMCC34011 TaxID=2248759 RepID=UPI000E2838FF|nr:N-(5'-phosphoribosyl)anthranilate isomerase [Tropicimonas sp. IMCC34011]